MHEHQARKILAALLGEGVALRYRRWTIPSTSIWVGLCYCEAGGVIRGIGGTWADLVEDVQGRIG